MLLDFDHGGCSASRKISERKSGTYSRSPFTTLFSSNVFDTQGGSLPAPASPTASNGPFYTPLAPDVVGLVDNSCSTSSKLKSDADEYSWCNEQDLPGYDVSGVVAYTLQQCVDACSTMNFIAGKKTCKAILLNDHLSATYTGPNHRANCWLKTVRGTSYIIKEPVGTVAVLNSSWVSGAGIFLLVDLIQARSPAVIWWVGGEGNARGKS